jgi:hypothetical protein
MGDNLCIAIVCSTFNVEFVVWYIKFNIRFHNTDWLYTGTYPSLSYTEEHCLSTCNTNFILAVFRHLYNISVEFPFLVLKRADSFFPMTSYLTLIFQRYSKKLNSNIYKFAISQQELEIWIRLWNARIIKHGRQLMYSYCLLNVQCRVCCMVD